MTSSEQASQKRPIWFDFKLLIYFIQILYNLFSHKNAFFNNINNINNINERSLPYIRNLKDHTRRGTFCHGGSIIPIGERSKQVFSIEFLDH